MTTLPLTYKAYEIVTLDGAEPTVVAVHDPRFRRNRPIYRTTSLDKAMRWIDAYRDGQAWATQDAIASR